MTQPKKMKIAIVDDHNLFRKGLIKLINLGDRNNKYSILFEAESGVELQEKLSKGFLPDIVLLDIDMPDMNGYEAAGWMKKHYPIINILVISMFESQETVIKMLRLGVKGYLSKDIEVADMHNALEAISDKGFYYSDFVAEAMASNLLNKEESESDETDIASIVSENEMKFLILACTELTYEEIADQMILSPKTIDGYRKSLFNKFKVNTRTGLAMFAVRKGLVKLEE